MDTRFKAGEIDLLGQHRAFLLMNVILWSACVLSPIASLLVNEIEVMLLIFYAAYFLLAALLFVPWPFLRANPIHFRKINFE